MKKSIKQLIVLGLALCVGFFLLGSSMASAYDYNQNPTTFGGFPKAGQLRVYYKDFLGGPGYSMSITKNGVSKNFNLPGYESQNIIDTGIQIVSGDIITVDVVEADADGGEAVGWIGVMDNKCGSGLPDGNGGHFGKVDVTQWISWANQAGEPLVSKQCWGDWPEWSGDLDFDDFFMVFSYVPQQAVQPTVDLKVNGQDSSITLQAPASYTLTWTSADATSCSASNAWSGNQSLSGSQYYSNMGQGTYTYTLTCTGPGGSASDSVTVYVTAYAPLTSILSVSKLSRDTAITAVLTYYENLYTVPGREVEFTISVANTGSVTASNVIVQDVLPAGLTYEIGTTFIDGNVSAEGIVNNGIALGSMSAGQTKVVRFRALVNSSASFAQAITQIINTASARADNATINSDTATVWVMKGQVLGASTVDTGADIATVVTFASTGFGAVMLGAYQIGRRMYWKNRIALLRKSINT